MALLTRPWTDEEIATVREMRAAGKPLYLIAARVRRSKGGVRYILQLRGDVDQDAKTDA